MAEEQPKAAAGNTDELAGLKSRVDELGSLMTQWQAARSSAVKIRTVVVLVILIFIFGYGGMLLKTLMRAGDESYKDEFRQAAIAKAVMLKDNLMPKLYAAYRQLGPVYKEAALADFHAHKDEMVQKLYDEMDGLKASAITKFRSTFDQTLHGLLEKQRVKLQETFPELKTEADLDTVIENLEQALSGAAYDVLNDRIQKAHDRLLQATETTLELVPADRRVQFHQRMTRFMDHVLTDTLNLRKQLGEK